MIQVVGFAGEAFDAVPARSRTAEPAPVRPAPALAVVTRPAGPVIAGVHHLALPGADLLVARHAGAPLVSLGLYRRRIGFDLLP